MRHALRTLIKSGQAGALKALGYGPPNVTLSRFAVLTEEVTLGGALEFEIEITSVADDVLELIAKGAAAGASFGFMLPPQRRSPDALEMKRPPFTLGEGDDTIKFDPEPDVPGADVASMMRWPWSKNTETETRQGQGFTADIIAARAQFFSGARGVAEATATVETCTSLWERAFTAADGPEAWRSVVSPALLGLVGRVLATQKGNSLP